MDKCKKNTPKQTKTTNQNDRNQKNFRQNSAKKKFKQVIYLRKGKPTKEKADAEKVNKQTRKNREINATKIKLLRNSKCKRKMPYLNSSNKKTRAKLRINYEQNLRQVVGTKVDERVTTGLSRLRYL
jgi:hypothetical protein